ncbi:glucan-binding YG repeat protein [Flavobacterium sp. HSC-61S13]|nr:glucan-binding YG repeat protein [Flavobacterium sp. HSC-61S13]
METAVNRRSLLFFYAFFSNINTNFKGIFENSLLSWWLCQSGVCSKKGIMLPDGTYYYLVIADGKTRTGWVQINR